MRKFVLTRFTNWLISRFTNWLVYRARLRRFSKNRVITQTKRRLNFADQQDYFLCAVFAGVWWLLTAGALGYFVLSDAPHEFVYLVFVSWLGVKFYENQGLKVLARVDESYNVKRSYQLAPPSSSDDAVRIADVNAFAGFLKSKDD